MIIATTPPTSIKAVVFDAYGTLVDVHGIARFAETIFPTAGTLLSARWREKQIEYTRLRTMSSRHASFSEVTRQSLRHACSTLSLPLDSATEERLMSAYLHLPAWPEARASIIALRALGQRIAVLSNGDPDDLAQLLRNAALDDLIEVVLSAQSVRKYKTAPEVYALAPAYFECEARELLFVSSNGWDACGAAWFGYASCWVNRSRAVPEQLDASVQYMLNDLSGLEQLLTFDFTTLTGEDHAL
jgi:2-haloacid dehalogenase